MLIDNQSDANWEPIWRQLRTNLMLIDFQSNAYRQPIWCQLRTNLVPIENQYNANWLQIWYQWKSIGHSKTQKLKVHVQTFLSMNWNNSQLANWRWIGRLQIFLTLRIWPKSRLLIGRELRILTSHWSRGHQNIFLKWLPLRSWNCANREFLTSIGNQLDEII